jgi:protein O-GlcNAc transferase
MGILGRLLGRPEPGDAPDSRPRADELIARGQALEDAEDLAGAERLFREAIAAAPRYPRAHLNLGNALQKQQRLDGSLAAHASAVAIDPGFAPGHYNAGVLLIELERYEEARRALEKALELDPSLADAAVHISRSHELQRDLAEACRQLQRAVRIDPNLAGAWENLGTLLMERRELLDSEKAFREALRADPRSVAGAAGLAQIEVDRGRARQAEVLFRQALDGKPSPMMWGAYLFSLNLRDDVDADAVARAHFEYGRYVRAEIGPPKRMPTPVIKGRRLRVGYVSGDLMSHPVAWFVKPILEHHDRDAIETFCYSNGHEDAMTDLLRPLSGHWRNVLKRDEDEVVETIRRDRLDLVVDLSGHTSRNLLAVLARRVAPVQATWLGYLNTTGLDTMDYRITDHFTDPEGMTERWHSEKLARMPHTQWCYRPHDSGELKPLREPSSTRPFVFGSYNQMSKLSDQALDVWCRILRRVPGSVLRVHAVTDSVAAADLVARLEQRGLPRSRLETRGRVSTGEYLASIEDCDMALDSMPYNGGTTTLDTFWMGTPIVVLAGGRGISRGGFSIASCIGVGELIAHSVDEYVERNVQLAQDHAARLALRRTLRPRLMASPLVDAPRFTRDLEALYRQMVAS